MQTNLYSQAPRAAEKRAEEIASLEKIKDRPDSSGVYARIALNHNFIFEQMIQERLRGTEAVEVIRGFEEYIANTIATLALNFGDSQELLILVMCGHIGRQAKQRIDRTRSGDEDISILTPGADGIKDFDVMRELQRGGR